MFEPVGHIPAGVMTAAGRLAEEEAYALGLPPERPPAEWFWSFEPARQAPGSVLAGELAWLDDLNCGDESELSTSQALDLAVAAHKQMAWTQSVLLKALARLDERFAAERQVVCDDVERGFVPEAADEFAAAARMGPHAADRLVGQARALSGRLFRTLQALAGGDVDPAHVREIVAGTEQLDDDAAEYVEAAGLAAAADGKTARQLRGVLERAAITVEPEAARDRHEQAKRQRGVFCYPSPDGMAALHAVGTASQIESISRVLHAVARRPDGDGDERTLAEREMDALHAIVTGAITAEGIVPGPERATAAEVQVVISAETLVGFSEQPGFLTGYGPIGANVARDLARDARRKWLITDATGSQSSIAADAAAPGG